MTQRQKALKALRFHDLTPYRVREVLLVSSPYDAFILEEDGQLTEKVFWEYREVSASGPPRFTQVSSVEAAFEAIAERRFDLILTMTNVAGMSVNDFGRKIKELRPGRPVVVLALDERELDRLMEALDPRAVDGSFLWTGDAQILLALIKYIEDRANVEHDIQHGNLRVIIVIEDSPRYYSSFLGMLYKQLMVQSRSLAAEGVNELHRLMYMRSRPKVLHATSYEQGVELFSRFQRNVVAVISDIRIPRYGKLDGTAGLDFARFARREDGELPVLLQSAEPKNAELAAEIGAVFLDKNSPTLLADLRTALTELLGFGDFVFRLPDGTEVARARGLRELEKVLPTVPDESIIHHASHDDFSVWLMARSEFEIAEQLRPKKISDFPSVEATREYLVETIRRARLSTYRGAIADFDPNRFEHQHFSRIGRGALGGKARGIAFLNRCLADLPASDFGGLTVTVPKTVVITTEYFDDFLDRNNLRDFARECESDDELAHRFLQGELPGKLAKRLRFLVSEIRRPLAVRSSSLLEDSLHQPFAGIYSTLMIANNNADPEHRLRELCAAVKLVYASTFSRNAKAFLRSSASRSEEEKMGVIVQPLIGRQRGNRFYPSFSGVAQSFNFYPVGPQQAEDGIVHVALGLGRLVVDGGLALRFSPRHPAVLPQFTSPQAMLDATQRTFYALDMDQICCAADADLYTNIKEFDLVDAEIDSSLAAVASVYSADDEQIRDDLRLKGPRVVTFSNILKHKAIPLAEALSRLLEVVQEGFGASVELEFAGEMGDWGAQRGPEQERLEPELFALQVRPFVARGQALGLQTPEFSRDDTLCASNRTLGHGVEQEVRDIVYVSRARWEAARNRMIASEVEELNQQMASEGRSYMLIGPGRWGTADPWLGIPVEWRQISSAKVIVEASPAGYDVEPSQGTHFFQNITSLRIGYLTLPPGAEKSNGSSDQYLDWDWLDRQSALQETRHLRHLRLKQPLTVVLDGREGRGVVAKPGSEREADSATP